MAVPRPPAQAVTAIGPKLVLASHDVGTLANFADSYMAAPHSTDTVATDKFLYGNEFTRATVHAAFVFSCRGAFRIVASGRARLSLLLASNEYVGLREIRNPILTD